MAELVKRSQLPKTPFPRRTTSEYERIAIARKLDQGNMSPLDLAALLLETISEEPPKIMILKVRQ